MTDGWEAMTDIGRYGLETAAAVVEGMLGLTREAGGARIPFLTPSGDPASDPARRLRADAEKLVELYAEWTRVLVERAIEVASTGGGGLSIGPVEPGAFGQGTAYLHAAGGQVRSTDLTMHEGAVIAAGRVHCDVADQVKVTVDVPDDAPPGRYYGHLLVVGTPDLSIAYSVDVGHGSPRG